MASTYNTLDAINNVRNVLANADRFTEGSLGQAMFILNNRDAFVDLIADARLYVSEHSLADRRKAAAQVENF